MATLVTGGTGFIGAAVVRELIANGEQEVAVFHVSNSTWRRNDLADGVTVIQGDPGNFSQLLDAVKQTQPSANYRFAAMLSVASDLDPVASTQASVNGIFNVLEAARQPLLEKTIKLIDDRFARQEWGWLPQLDAAAFIDDILLEPDTHPGRYGNP